MTIFSSRVILRIVWGRKEILFTMKLALSPQQHLDIQAQGDETATMRRDKMGETEKAMYQEGDIIMMWMAPRSASHHVHNNQYRHLTSTYILRNVPVRRRRRGRRRGRGRGRRQDKTRQDKKKKKRKEERREERRRENNLKEKKRGEESEEKRRKEKRREKRREKKREEKRREERREKRERVNRGLTFVKALLVFAHIDSEGKVASFARLCLSYLFYS